MIWHDTLKPGSGTVQASQLKICDLCGALNLAANVECHVCRWRGKFDNRREVVQLAMDLMERQQGRIDPNSLANGAFHYTVTYTLMDRIRAFFSRIQSRRRRRSA
jgi:hypothetical protein